MSRWELFEDEGLLAALSVALDNLDPVSVEAVRAGASSWEISHVDGELAALAADSSSRGQVILLSDEEDMRCLTFVANQLTVEIKIDCEHQAVGVMSPGVAKVIEVERASMKGPPFTMRTVSDQLGQFRLGLVTGLCRLRIGTGPEAVVTSWFSC